MSRLQSAFDLLADENYWWDISPLYWFGRQEVKVWQSLAAFARTSPCLEWTVAILGYFGAQGESPVGPDALLGSILVETQRRVALRHRIAEPVEQLTPLVLSHDPEDVRTAASGSGNWDDDDSEVEFSLARCIGGLADARLRRWVRSPREGSEAWLGPYLGLRRLWSQFSPAIRRVELDFIAPEDRAIDAPDAYADIEIHGLFRHVVVEAALSIEAAHS